MRRPRSRTGSGSQPSPSGAIIPSFVMRHFRRHDRPAPAMSASFASGTGVLVVGRVAVAAMGWAGTVLVVHALSPSDWGGYSLVFAVLNLVSLVATLRLGAYVTADILAAGDDPGPLVSSYATMRLLLGVGCYLAALASVALLGYPPAVLVATGVAGLSLVIASQNASLDLLFITRHWMRSVAVAGVLGQAAQLVVTVLLVASGTHSLVVLAAPALLYDGAALVWRLGTVRGRVHIRVPTLEWSRWRVWFRDAIPLSIGGALTIVYTRIDSVILSKLVGLAAVGKYAIGYKFADLVAFFPTALTATLLVTLTAARREEPGRFTTSFGKAFLVVTVVAVGTAVVFGVYSAPLIRLLYGARYVDAARATQGLVLGELLAFYTALCFTALAAVNRNRAYPVAALIGLVVNVGLNLVLVPTWSYNGAALATVLTEVFVLAILARAASRIPEVGPVPWGASTRVVGAGVVMAVVAVGLGRVVPWPVAAASSCVVYVAGLQLLRVGGPAGLRDLLKKPVPSSAPVEAAPEGEVRSPPQPDQREGGVRS
jgi:O-antigen/teichoic acid export membrane protein